MSSSACIVALVVLALCTCNCQLENDVVIPEAPAYALYKIPLHRSSIRKALRASAAYNDLDVGALEAGGGEPDEFPCYGANKDMVSQGADGLVSWCSHNHMSPCRIATQPYHASPPPLVESAGYQFQPIDYPGNCPDKQLVSTITMRQWQTQLSRIMTNEMFYALVHPDIKEASKKLGNMFHTLGDSFSASHVVRTNAQKRDTGGTCAVSACDQNRGSVCKSRKCLCEVGYTVVDGRCQRMAGTKPQICEALIVEVAISMDVVNWKRHSGADEVDDDNLYDCLVYFQKLVLNIWHQHRALIMDPQVLRQDKFAAVNNAIHQLTTEVLCKALNVEHHPQAPAGGATAYYSSASGFTGTDQAVMPRGLLSEQDAQAQHDLWNRELKDFRNTCVDGLGATDSRLHSYALPMKRCRKENAPVAVSYPPRDAPSMCQDPSQFYVTSEQLRDWRVTFSKTYLQPDAVE